MDYYLCLQASPVGNPQLYPANATKIQPRQKPKICATSLGLVSETKAEWDEKHHEHGNITALFSIAFEQMNAEEFNEGSPQDSSSRHRTLTSRY